MAIDMTPLLGLAGFDTSKNGYLGRIHALAVAYNSMPPAQVSMRVEALDTLMLIAADWLTSKRPTTTAKNNARWNALANLADQCAAEAQTLGAKQLTSPSNFKEIKGDPRLGRQSYWLERMDPQRRPGFVLSGLYEGWLTSGTLQDFWTHIGSQGLHQVNAFDPHSTSTKLAQVKLLDESQKAKRTKYKGTFNSAGLVRNLYDQPLTTWGMHTAASGGNWGIFALSLEGDLYVHSHKVGRFHHSTFLGGGATAAAGEICIDDVGNVRVITNKTGHYRASIPEMERMVRMLPIDPETLILPDLMRAGGAAGQALFYRVGDFRANGVAAKPVSKFTVNMRIPGWAKSPTVKRLIAKIP